MRGLSYHGRVGQQRTRERADVGESGRSVKSVLRLSGFESLGSHAWKTNQAGPWHRLLIGWPLSRGEFRVLRLPLVQPDPGGPGRGTAVIRSRLHQPGEFADGEATAFEARHTG